MSQAIETHPNDELRELLVEHRETFEILADHDDDEVAELLGEFPLELIDELPAEGEGDE